MTNLNHLLPKLLLLVIAITLAACQQEDEPTQETTATTAVTEDGTAIVPVVQDTRSGVVADGVVEPLYFVDLSFQTGGQVAELLVEEGDLVQAGDPLIRLDTIDAEVALSQAEAKLNTAEAGLAVAETQLTLAQAGVDTAAGRVTIAEAQLALTKSDATPQEIAAAESGLAAAEAGITQAVGSRDASLTISDAQIRAAEANVAAAMADRRAIEEGYDTIIETCFDLPDGSEICPLYGAVEESTRSQLEAARAGESAAQAALDQLNAGPTSAQRRAAGGGVALASANRDVAQARLNLLLAGATPEQIEIVEVGVDQAAVGVALAEVSIAEAETALSQAQVNVTNAQVAVEAAQLALDRMTLTAPFDGVVAQVNVNPGEVVSPSQSVLALADFNGWQVKTTDLTELDVALIDPDAEVDVNFDAIPGETVKGTITNIALAPGIIQGDTVYEVTIRLEAAPDLPLRWGMTATIDVET